MNTDWIDVMRMFYEWSEGFWLHKKNVVSVNFPGVLYRPVIISMSDGHSYQRVFTRIEELSEFENWLGLQDANKTISRDG